MSDRMGLGSEHPLNDAVQPIFFVAYFAVWGLGSFTLHVSTMLAVVPVFIRLIPGILILAFSVYLERNAHNAVFGKTDEETKLITTGVYGWVRHPMYLGSLLICLGFFLTTLSLLSFIIWVGLFVFFDRMATYEERDLQRILGASYLEYQKSAPKWLLRRGKERKNRFARDKRTLYNEIPSRVEYSMTPKGQGLVEPLLPLIQWIANDKQ